MSAAAPINTIPASAASGGTSTEQTTINHAQGTKSGPVTTIHVGARLTTNPAFPIVAS